MNDDDRKKATTPPEHLIALVAKYVPAPEQRYPYPYPAEKLAQWHREQCTKLATLIWAEAYHAGSMAGSARTLATMSVQYMIVTAEEKASIVERIEAEAKGTPS